MDEPREPRIIKFTSSDQTEFALRMTKFLDEEAAFKTGYVGHGITALNLLLQMYRIKTFKLYLKKDKDKAMGFVDEIDALRANIYNFLKTKEKTDGDPNYLGNLRFTDLDNSFDALVAKFYIIESECGI
jgi:hypothetical protein